MVNIKLNIHSKYDYKDVNMAKLQTKPLTKLITRLAKVYRVKSDATPNVVKAKNYGALQFLLHKKYQERSLSEYLDWHIFGLHQTIVDERWVQVSQRTLKLLHKT